MSRLVWVVVPLLLGLKEKVESSRTILVGKKKRRRVMGGVRPLGAEVRRSWWWERRRRRKKGDGE